MHPAHADAGYTLCFQPHHDAVRAHVSGSASLANTRAYWQELVAEVHARQARRVLLIDELRGAPLTAEQWFDLVQDLRHQGLEGVRIAHVKPLGLEQIEYCEIYAKEAGLDARVFVDIATADVWLRHGVR